MTIDEAKELFFRYNCSLFAMAREEKEAYENYKKLNISSSTENKWKKELFISLAKQLKISGESELFNRMYNLSDNQHDKERLVALIQALNEVVLKDSKTIAIVCETVLGRKALSERTGMVFWAYDLGEQEKKKKLLMFVWVLLSKHKVETNLQARYERDIKKCSMINSELSLEVCI